jgi:outer membrane protein assembly factor BamA
MNRLLAVLCFALVAAPFGNVLAGAASRTEPQDSTNARGFLARTAERFSLFDWMRGGGGGGRSDSTSAMCVDLERDCKNLQPFYGCTVDTIIVSGNTRTKTKAILREMATKQGERLEERLIRRDSAYLRGLAYFAEVGIVAEESGYGKCRILVTLAERPGIFMRVPYPVVNYDFEKGLSFGATWKVKNFRGLAEDLSVSAIRRRDKEEGANFSWNVPWFLGRRMRFRFDAYTYRRIEMPVDAEEEYIAKQHAAGVGIGIPVTRNLVKQLWFKTNLSFEGRESWLLDPAGGASGDFHWQNFVSAGAEIEYDSRSNRISPFTGMLHRIRARRYTSLSGPEQHYVFYGFSDYFYIPVGTERSFILAVSGDIREGDVPSYLNMKLGGVRDVRGFSDQNLRGSTKLAGTVQYRAQLFGPHVFRLPKIGEFDFTMNGVVFVDNGALMNSILDVDRATFHTTGGLGVELISPFRDIIRLEMASDGTGDPAFYMTAGTVF